MLPVWDLCRGESRKYVNNLCLKIFVASCLSTGSDKDAIVAILGARSNKQRQEIAAKYQQTYNKVKLISQS